MAFNFASSTDRVGFGALNNPNVAGTLSCFLKTTQTTNQAAFWTTWNSSSRRGIGLLINNVGAPNKLTAVNYTTGSDVAIKASTTTINDGNWHHLAWVYSQASGGTNEMFVDGVSQGTVNNSAAWSYSNVDDARPIFGDTYGSFWPTIVGDLAECASFTRQLTAAEIVALARGAPTLRFRPHVYCPFIRDHHNITNGYVQDFIGTTVSRHPPIRRIS